MSSTLKPVRADGKFRSKRYLAGIVLCLLMATFSTVVKLAGYRHEAPAKTIAAMKLWQVNQLEAVSATQSSQQTLPSVALLTALAAVLMLASFRPSALPARSPAPRANAWFSPQLLLRPPPIR